MNITDKVAVITGASRGPGRQIALKLAKEGAKVAICARKEKDLKDVSEEIIENNGTALSFPVDISNYTEIEEFIRKIHNYFGKVDILINNADVGWYKPFDQWTLQEIDMTIDSNLKGVIYMTRAILPDMFEKGKGQIINISVNLGQRIIPNMAVYTASKLAVMGFADSILKEFKDKGINVITLTPEVIDKYFSDYKENTMEDLWTIKPGIIANLVYTTLTQQNNIFDEQES